MNGRAGFRSPLGLALPCLRIETEGTHPLRMVMDRAHAQMCQGITIAYRWNPCSHRNAAIIELSCGGGEDGMATGITQSAERLSLADSICEFQTETGRSLLELADESPVLLVFLRHFSSAFCAQAIDKVSQLRAKIEAKGVRPVFVHLGTRERAKAYFDYYNLSDVERISNPEATLYQLPVFGLSRTNPFSHFLNLTVWKGWLKGAMFKYGIGMIKEDADQMPGVFFLKERKIVRAFRHRTIADEPDYLKLIGAG